MSVRPNTPSCRRQSATSSRGQAPWPGSRRQEVIERLVHEAAERLASRRLAIDRDQPDDRSCGNRDPGCATDIGTGTNDQQRPVQLAGDDRPSPQAIGISRSLIFYGSESGVAGAGCRSRQSGGSLLCSSPKHLAEQAGMVICVAEVFGRDNLASITDASCLPKPGRERLAELPSSRSVGERRANCQSASSFSSWMR